MLAHVELVQTVEEVRAVARPGSPRNLDGGAICRHCGPKTADPRSGCNGRTFLSETYRNAEGRQAKGQNEGDRHGSSQARCRLNRGMNHMRFCPSGDLMTGVGKK